MVILNLFYTAIKHSLFDTYVQRSLIWLRYTTMKYLFCTPLYRGTTRVKIASETSFVWAIYVSRLLPSINETKTSTRWPTDSRH